MNEPYRSILDQEFDNLFQFVTTIPRARWGLSETGRTPAQLAFQTGSGISTAIIVGEFPEALAEIEWSYEQLIEELISEYSELSICSGWNEEIEYELWAVLNDEYRAESPVRLLWPSSGVKQSILKVARQAEKWVVWNENQKGPTPINLNEWLDLYSLWKKSANSGVTCNQI